MLDTGMGSASKIARVQTARESISLSLTSTVLADGWVVLAL